MAIVFARLAFLFSHNSSSLSFRSHSKARNLRPVLTFGLRMSSASGLQLNTVAKPDEKIYLNLAEVIPAMDSTNVTVTALSRCCTNSELNEQEPQEKDTPPLAETNTLPPTKRVRLRKIIFLMSYSGQGYFGMQKNPDTKTIEDDLLQALLKCNYIDDECYKKPQLLHFQRAARTDKGVSAARQIVSLKLPDNLEISNVNECLPPEIRIMGMKRVTKTFDAKCNCDARTYSYMIPTFAFAPVEEKTTEDYRITEEVLEEVRITLKLFLGTKNYHNFTSRKRAGDPSAQRHIISFTCVDPFIQDGLEYVILRVKGQSFMMHQIRKMIGLVVAILRGFAGSETMKKVWEIERIDIPRAPGLGLMLDHVHYERYDKRFGKDGMHELLTWEHLDSQVETFCKTYIYQVMTKTENEEKSMLNWLATLPYHTYDVRQVHLQDVGGYSKIGKAYLKLARENKLSEDDEECEGDGDDDDSGKFSAKRQKLSASASTS